MNEMIDLIKTRRSIRKYKAKAIPLEEINLIIECAMYAPSAGNQRPWEFIVVTDKSTLEQVAKISPYAMMAKEAPLVIAVCGNQNNERHKGFWIEDCSAATENLLLAAHSLGIGAVWTGVYPKEDIVAKYQKLFNLPEKVSVLGIIVLGYPNEKPAQQDRYEEKKIHYEKW